MFFSDEVVVDVVEQGGLFVGFGAFSPNVVEEDGKCSHAEVVHFLEFCHEGVAVGIGPFDVNARVNGPIEVYAARFGSVDELAYAGCFGVGIGFAPMVAVIGVVFGSVDVDIHFVSAVEVELTQAVFMAPWCAIEALDDATVFHVGPVGDGANLKFALAHDAEQGLHAIVESAVGVCGNGGAAPVYVEIIGFFARGHLFFDFAHSFVAHEPEAQGEAGFGVLPWCGLVEGFRGDATLSRFIADDVPGGWSVEEGLASGLGRGGDFLWYGIDKAHLSRGGHGAEQEQTHREKAFFHGML